MGSKLYAIGVGGLAALLALSAAAPAGAEPRVAAAPAVGDFPPPAIPDAGCTAGTVFTVSAAEGTGEGSFYQAVWAANENPGIDSVVIPAGMTVVADYTVPLTESVRVCGADAATSKILLASPDPEHRLETPPADALTPRFNDPEWIPDYYGSLLDATLLVDRPISASMSSLTIDGQLDPDGSFFEAVFVSSSTDRDVPLVYRDLTLSGLGSLAKVRADSGSIYADGLRVDSTISGNHTSLIDTQTLHGELSLTNSTLTGLDTAAVTVWDGYLGDDQRITLDHVTLSDGNASNTLNQASLIAVPGVLGRGELAADMPSATDPLLVLNEVTVTNVFPEPDLPAAQPSVVALRQVYGDVLVANTSISQPAQDRAHGYGQAAIALQGVSGRLAVVDSSLTDLLGSAIDYQATGRWEQSDRIGLTIERSDVARVGRLDDGSTPAVTAHIATSDPLTEPVLQLTDSQFVELSTSEGPGGVMVNFSAAVPARAAVARVASETVPAVKVSGTTFANNGGREANDLVAGVFGDWDADAAAVEIENSTFSGTQGGEGYAEQAVQVYSAAGALRLTEVTMHGLGVAQAGMGEDNVTMQVANSAIQTGDGLSAMRAEDAAVPVATSTTVTDASGAALGADAATAAAMGLWELAENGGQAFRDGSTILTHLPATSSVLVDSAAAAAATATDQRGVARPQGPAPDRGAVEVVLNEVSAMLGLDGSARVTAGKPATLTASRTGSSAGEVSATVRLSGGAAARAADGAAIAGTDYVDDTIVVRWADGETADQTFTIKTLARGEAGTRTLTATLEDPSGNAVLGDDTSATVTIVERAAASTDPAEPTDPSEPGTAQPPAGGTDGLATTGGESPAAWFALAAALAAAGGATLVASRRSARSRV